MNSSQIHLALTHVPVILSILGLVVMIVAMAKRNDTLTRTAFFILLFAGLAAVPVYYTGEGAEETVEHLPGVSEAIIEKHEDVAKIGFGTILVTAIGSLAALVVYRKTDIMRLLKPFVFLLALATAGIMVATAHFGGQVRHSEIRPGVEMPMNNHDPD
jgi:uncharacterized membrane protein